MAAIRPDPEEVGPLAVADPDGLSLVDVCSVTGEGATATLMAVLR